MCQTVHCAVKGRLVGFRFILDGSDCIMTQEVVTIENKTGIHARPASIFVQTATKFKSKIQLKAKGKTVDAKSILMIMSLGLVKGTEITILADGPDEADAVKALKDLVDSKFGEE
ncbi:putative phosphocarrier protein HPr [Mitsuokella sp. oral taxon 131 str. W9106]|nr:putative phosphocarrier protein HPr [Mitsuokella sp. oral taxon 131 str. W9106]